MPDTEIKSPLARPKPMDIDNKKHLLGFLFIGGVLAYLLHAAFGAVFVVAVPLAPDWCHDFQEVQTAADEYKQECFAFKNAFEEAKYRHNQRMIGRNKFLIAVQFGLWFAAAGLVFHWIPTWRGIPLVHDGAERFFAIAVLAFATSVIAPLVLSWLLPPPVEWFPSIFREINDAQVEAALRHIAGTL